MTHTRYWALSVATGVAGGFIAIERFAFAQETSIWIAFGVAIAATVFSLAAFGVALLRENHAFSGYSALCAFGGAFTIIATRAFAAPTALWLAFAAGIALLAVSLRALALHETTVERVTYELEHGVPLAAVEAEQAAVASPEPQAPATRAASLARRLEVSAPMRSWTYWLMHTGIAVGGAFIVLMTYALSVPGTTYDTLRWLAFGVGAAAAAMATGALLQRILLRDGAGAVEGEGPGRLAAIAVTAASLAISVGMIVTMAIYTTSTLRWIAFALGLGLVGSSLLAHLTHELSSERVRHELEISAPSRQAQPAGAPPAHAA